jgi:hypothetical protein
VVSATTASTGQGDSSGHLWFASCASPAVTTPTHDHAIDVACGATPASVTSVSTDGRPAERRREEADDRERVEDARTAGDVEHEEHWDGDEEHRGHVQPPEPHVPGIALAARDDTRPRTSATLAAPTWTVRGPRIPPAGRHHATSDDWTVRPGQPQVIAPRGGSRRTALSTAPVPGTALPLHCCRAAPERRPVSATIDGVEQGTGIDVAAPAPHVWDVLVDVERWPEWTDSVTSVRLLCGGPLAVGSRVELSQPRIPTGTYTVTELEPGSVFVWSSASQAARCRRTTSALRCPTVAPGSSSAS